MLKKIAFIGLGLSVFAAPLVSSAFTISELQSQLRALAGEISQMQNGSNAAAAASALPDDYGTGTTDTGIYCPKLSTTLQRGSRDASTAGQVSELQTFLTGYFNLDENVVVGGYFGNLTQSYVVKFQQQNGLPSLGIAGSLTRAKIASVCGGGQPDIPTSTSVSAMPKSKPTPTCRYLSASDSAKGQKGITFNADVASSADLCRKLCALSRYSETSGSSDAAYCYFSDGTSGKTANLFAATSSQSTVQAAVQPTANAPTITLLSPSAGQQIPIGSTYTIKWQSSGMPSTAFIEFELQGADGTTYVIPQSGPTAIPSQGSYNWLLQGALCPSPFGSGGCTLAMNPGQYALTAKVFTTFVNNQPSGSAAQSNPVSITLTGTGSGLPVPVINSFTASSNTVMFGQPITFSWSTSNAQDGWCYLASSVNYNSALNIANPGVSGSFMVTALSSATYTLTCSSSKKDGYPTVQRSLSVNVTPANI